MRTLNRRAALGAGEGVSEQGEKGSTHSTTRQGGFARIADPDVTLKGILRRNTPGLGHNTEHRLDNATIEVDLSEVDAVDESLKGMPMSVEGHFEPREHPELSARWVFKAHSAQPGVFSDACGGLSSAPPSSV
jgi:hypothetical protein